MYSFTEIANHFEQVTEKSIQTMTLEQLKKAWVKTWDIHEEAYLEEDTDTCVRCSILMDGIDELLLGKYRLASEQLPTYKVN